MRTDELLLIDFHSLAVPIWMTSGNEPDPNAASTKMVARVRALASEHAHCAIATDSGKSLRKEWDSTYKANRAPSEAPMRHQIALALETLAADGFPIWKVDGYEADDICAAAVKRALALPDITVLVVSSDKDLLALVSDRVRAKSLVSGTVFDVEAVKAKLGVPPSAVPDYLSLMGDTSDNIIGAKGIGPKKAADLLATFGSIDALYAAIDKNEAKLQPAVLASLTEFRPRSAMVRKLVTLMNDVAIPFEEIANERVPKDAENFGMDEADPETGEFVEDAPEGADDGGESAELKRLGMPETEKDRRIRLGLPLETAQDRSPQPEAQAPAAPAVPSITATQPSPSVPKGGDIGHSQPSAPATAAMVVREPEGPAPAEFERGLEPRSMRDAQALSKDLFASRLFSAYGHPAGIMATVLAGRELGIQAIASLRAMHIIDGKPTLAADLIRALVIRSKQAKFFRCTERTATHATFETQRGDDPPISLTYSIAEGRTAFGFTPDMPEKDKVAKEAKWAASGWGRNPADLCVARCGSKLARLVYPDVVHGLLASEEFD